MAILQQLTIFQLITKHSIIGNMNIVYMKPVSDYI